MAQFRPGHQVETLQQMIQGVGSSSPKFTLQHVYVGCNRRISILIRLYDAPRPQVQLILKIFVEIILWSMKCSYQNLKLYIATYQRISSFTWKYLSHLD
jgi:hypothetical protein